MKNNDIYVEAGDHAVLLFHAFTSSPVDVKSLSNHLSRQNYTVYAPVLLGHGGPVLDTLDYKISDWLDQGLEAYDFLVKQGYQEISVFGLSLGGVVATHVGIFKDVKAFGTFSAPVSGISQGNAVVNQFTQTAISEESSQKIQQDQIKTHVRKVMKDLNQHIEQMKVYYPLVTGAVFIAQGGQDELIDPQEAVEFREMLFNAQIDFHWYEDAPHVITTGQYGKILQDDLSNFLSTI